MGRRTAGPRQHLPIRLYGLAYGPYRPTHAGTKTTDSCDPGPHILGDAWTKDNPKAYKLFGAPRDSLSVAGCVQAGFAASLGFSAVGGLIFVGASTMVIRRPANLGNCSILEISENSSTISANMSLPMSR